MSPSHSHSGGPLLRARAALAIAALLGCAGAVPEAAPRACLGVEASSSVNLYDGQAHVVVLSFYPLQGAAAFEAADVRDLLRGERPAGATGAPWEQTLLPGQRLRVEEPLPEGTRQLGVIADFYRSPARAVLAAACAAGRDAALLLDGSELRVARGGSRTR